MNKKPARIIADNRVTVPEEFRDAYDLEEGDRVWVTVEPIEEEGDNPYSHAKRR